MSDLLNEISPLVKCQDFFAEILWILQLLLFLYYCNEEALSCNHDDYQKMR